MKIQVSTTAKPRDKYTTKFYQNVKSGKTWTPKKPSVFKTLKFENASLNPSDYYAPVCISYRDNDTFIAPNNPCVVFVLCVGANGYGSDAKDWSPSVPVPWSNPVYGWQIRNQVKHKFQAHNQSSTRRSYIHNPPQNSVAEPSSFGSYISSNAGLNIAENTTTMYQIYRSWLCTGWDGWWALGDRFRRSYWANETQNINISSGAYDGDLLGCDGEVKFGIFRLSANEVVPVVVGNGFVKGHVDIVYFELKNGNDEAIAKPSLPNDITANIPITPTNPNPTVPVNPTATTAPTNTATATATPTNTANPNPTVPVNPTATTAPTNTATATAAPTNTATNPTATTAAPTNTATNPTATTTNTNTATTNSTATTTAPTNTATNPTATKSVYGGGFNIDNFNMEQLAYMYINSLAFMDIFHVANNNGNTTMVHNPISQARKQELQDVYNLYKNQNNPIVKSYANTMFGALSSYITMYPFYVNKDMAHLQTLEDLIQENHQTIQGQTYTHEFKQNVINMPSNDFVDNITRWIRELDGIIVR